MAPKEKGFNEYEIDGDIIKIFVPKRNGEMVFTITNKKFLNKLIELNVHWFASWNRVTQSYYIRSNLKIDGKKRMISLHRFIIDCKEYKNFRVRIDHKNLDTLDNREENLRTANASTNSLNRKGKNKNNSTGYRNICFHKGQYHVQLQIDGKSKSWRFKNLEEAINFAEKMRQKYYGEFAGRG